jgi:hypothetical protein
LCVCDIVPACCEEFLLDFSSAPSAPNGQA